jgi:urocanate hydratase
MRKSTSEAMLDFQTMPAPKSPTTATTSAPRSPSTRAVENAFDFPGFVPAYIRPLF